MNINKNLLLKQHPTILWTFTVHADRKIDANKPDITINDHKNNFCLLVELMFSMDKNLLSGEFGKISKYKDMEIEIKQIWYLKPTLIPVILGAFGTVKKVQVNIYNKSWKAKSNRKPESCTSKPSKYSEKNIVNLNQ